MNFNDDDDNRGTMGNMTVLPPMSIAGAAQLDKAAIDQQIATARAYPRSIHKAQRNLLSLVTLDQETAEECQYALTRQGKPIIGPSIRFAEIAQVAWGNMRSVSRIIDEGKEFITANAVCHDLETNVATSVDVVRRITGRNGQRYNADMIMTTGNAAVSIALRNAILRVIPKPFWRAGFAEAQRVVMGDVKTLVERRAAAFKWLAGYGVDEARILAKLNRPSVQDIDVEDLVILRALGNTIKEGETTPEVAFPDPNASVDRSTVQGFNPLDKAAEDEGGADEGDRGRSPDRASGGAGSDRARSGEQSAPGAQRTGGARASGDAGAQGNDALRAEAGATEVRPASVAGDQAPQQEPAPKPKTERKPRQAKADAAPAQPPMDVLKEFETAVNKAIENVSLDELRALQGTWIEPLKRLNEEDYGKAETIYNNAYDRIEAAIQPQAIEEPPAISRGDEYDRNPPEEETPAANEPASTPAAPPAAGVTAEEVRSIYAEARPDRGSDSDFAVWDMVAAALHNAQNESDFIRAWDDHKDAMEGFPPDMEASIRVVRFKNRKRLGL